MHGAPISRYHKEAKIEETQAKKKKKKRVSIQHERRRTVNSTT